MHLLEEGIVLSLLLPHLSLLKILDRELNTNGKRILA
jgi:hypothetical protein